MDPHRHVPRGVHIMLSESFGTGFQQPPSSFPGFFVVVKSSLRQPTRLVSLHQIDICIFKKLVVIFFTR
ncbi:hypothetical protein O181_036682 [Austropuccinia psidii MF-1]|uniref:Uncharacterized protein n=1 Tax=Austropuccinia psidii MF-1 TaxID=1389203 RepID=A0A9Q3DB63_9BASI|nr:hypothetical protein [Austropuccinia psidii MF-1]